MTKRTYCVCDGCGLERLPSGSNFLPGTRADLPADWRRLALQWQVNPDPIPVADSTQGGEGDFCAKCFNQIEGKLRAALDLMRGQ